MTRRRSAWLALVAVALGAMVALGATPPNPSVDYGTTQGPATP